MNGPRPLWLLLLVAPLLGGAACASDTKRDQFYNTDLGANWVPQDADLVTGGNHDAPGEAGEAADGGLESRDATSDGPDAGAAEAGLDAAPAQ